MTKKLLYIICII